MKTNKLHNSKLEVFQINEERLNTPLTSDEIKMFKKGFTVTSNTNRSVRGESVKSVRYNNKRGVYKTPTRANCSIDGTPYNYMR